MYIKNSVKIYIRELEEEGLNIFSIYYILYALSATIFQLPSALYQDQNFFQSRYVYWKFTSTGILFILGFITFFNKFPIKYYRIFLSFLQIYFYVCFSFWNSEFNLGSDSDYMLIIPITANIDWKFGATSALIANIFEIILAFHMNPYSTNYWPVLTKFFKSFLSISIAAFIRQKSYKKVLSQHEKDKTSLLHLQNFINNVIPSSIIVIRNRKVIYQNLETRRLLRHPKNAEIEEFLNKIIITEIKVGSKYQSLDRLLQKEIRLFDYLYQKNNDMRSVDDLDEIYGKFEEMETRSIYDNFSQRIKHLEIKLFKILWDGEESLILIMSGDYRAEKRLAEQARSKDKLLATVSHNLRTPLNGVIGLLEVVLEIINDKIIKRSLTIALRSSRLLLFLINDILDLRLISNNQLKLNPTLFNLFQGIKDVAKLIKFQAKNKGLQFELVNKFPTSVEVLIKNDLDRFKQVILNLLSNALKFTSKGYIRLCIEPNEAPFPVKISVEDSGIGIKKEDISKLFIIFGKLECKENKYINENGIGMGLAISQGLVRSLNNDSGDEIQIITEYGKGSIFHFLLRDLKMNSPLNSIVNEGELEECCCIDNIKQINAKFFKEWDKHFKESISNIDEEEQRNEHLSPRTINILVDDDDQINIMVFTTYPKTFSDCIFDLAFNGQQALDLIHLNSANHKFYDLIFMDCNMPIMDGFEATRKIVDMEKHSLIPRTPVIAATANVSPSDYEFCFKNGMVDFLSKPFTKQQLREMIDKYRYN